MKTKEIMLSELGDKIQNDVRKFTIEAYKLFIEKYGKAMNEQNVKPDHNGINWNNKSHLVYVITLDGLKSAYYDFKLKEWRLFDWSEGRRLKNLLVPAYVEFDDSHLHAFRYRVVDYITGEDKSLDRIKEFLTRAI